VTRDRRSYTPRSVRETHLTFNGSLGSRRIRFGRTTWAGAGAALGAALILIAPFASAAPVVLTAPYAHTSFFPSVAYLQQSGCWNASNTKPLWNATSGKGQASATSEVTSCVNYNPNSGYQNQSLSQVVVGGTVVLPISFSSSGAQSVYVNFSVPGYAKTKIQNGNCSPPPTGRAFCSEEAQSQTLIQANVQDLTNGSLWRGANNVVIVKGLTNDTTCQSGTCTLTSTVEHASHFGTWSIRIKGAFDATHRYAVEFQFSVNVYTQDWFYGTDLTGASVYESMHLNGAFHSLVLSSITIT
jgi:hypothetical protein